MRYANRNALILGAGKSGEAAANWVTATGGRAAVVDEAWQGARLAELGAQGIRCLRATRERLPDGAFDLVVTSPSIAAGHPWLETARARGLHVISELELGADAWRGDLIAVTGSKGKSSVVKAVASALRLAGREACEAGNYGTPLCARALERADRGAGATAVVEASSFQLEQTQGFAPRLAAILNIQADHLDRHGSLEAYAAAKGRIFEGQRGPACRAFLPPGLSAEAVPEGVAVERFGPEAACTWRYVDGAVLHGGARIPVTGYFANAVLGPAAALAAALLDGCGLTGEEIAAGFAAFEPLPHRMERVGTRGGVAYVDDSKGTSLAATQAALRIVGRGARLIAGGRLKERDLAFLLPDLAACAVKAYLIGEAEGPLYEAWHGTVPCVRCGELARAFHAAEREARPGETVLLSPGCASFDQFPNMAARGELFRRLFEGLPPALR